MVRVCDLWCCFDVLRGLIGCLDVLLFKFAAECSVDCGVILLNCCFGVLVLGVTGFRLGCVFCLVCLVCSANLIQWLLVC